MKSLAEKILKALEENAKPTSLVFMGSQLLFKEEKHNEIIEYFQEQMECAPDETYYILGNDVELIKKVKNHV